MRIGTQRIERPESSRPAIPVNTSSSTSRTPTATRPASGASSGGESHDSVVAASQGTSGATVSAGSWAT